MSTSVMIETKRLQIIPLSYEQLLQYAACDHSLEDALGVKYKDEGISPELKEALENTIIPNVADRSKNYLFSTLWTAITKEEREMVGDLCIIGEPNAAGEIEIGYGTYQAFQGKSFMTEIVSGIIEWARKEVGVKFIVASTDKNNLASYRVLEKNYFKLKGETNTMLQWQLEL